MAVRILTFDSAASVVAAGVTADSGTWVLDAVDRPANTPSAPSTSSGPNTTLSQTDLTAGVRRVSHLTAAADAPNFEETQEVKIFTDGTVHQAGIIFRGAIGSGYALQFDATANTITLFNTAGQWTRLAQKTTVSTGDDYVTTDAVLRVKINVNGSIIKVYVNDVVSFQATDSTHTGMYWGWYTFASHAWFDNIVISPLGATRTVRTIDWIKGSTLLEVQETGDTTDYFYNTVNSNNSLTLLQGTNVNTVMIVVPCHMHSVTSNEIWWDSNDANHYDTSSNPTANDNKLNQVISTIHGMTYTDADGQSQRLRVILNCGRFDLKTDGGWRGDLNPSNRATWWTNYKAFVVKYATLAATADVEYLVIGSELRNLEGGVNSTDVTDWEDLIAQVNAVYAGQLIYGIEWSSSTAVLQTITTSATWLNNVDVIGINAYFELVGSYTMLGANVALGATTITLPIGEISKYAANTLIQIEDDVSNETNYISSISGNIITLQSATDNAYTTAQNARIVEASALSPGLNDIIRGWNSDRTGESPYNFVATINTAYGKPMLFTEIGYRSLMGSAMFPWSRTTPPTAKHANILTYEADTNNSWGWLADNVMRDNVSTQELAYAAALIRWWDVDWFWGMVFVGWTGNPNDGFSTATQNAFFDADFTPQNKPTQTVLTNMFAAPNVRESFVTTTTYTTLEQVARLLQVPTFTGSTPVTAYEVRRLIQQAEDWIDLITNSAWRPRTVTELYEFTLHGIKLNREPIRSVTRVRVYNGQVFETKSEGRGADYWVDSLQGIVYFAQDPFVRAIAPQILWTFRGWGQYKRPVEVTYTWGRYIRQSGGNQRDKFSGAVEYITTVWVARQLAMSNDYSVLWPSGTDKVALEAKLKFWGEELEKFQIRQDKLFVI